MSHTSGQEARIRTLAPISRLSLTDQEAVLSQGMFLTFSAGEIVYAQGREDNYANYLLEGGVEFLWNGRFVRHLDAEQSAIKRALDGPGAKRYTVRARTWSLVLRIERTELERRLRLADLDPGTSSPEESDIAREQPSNWMIRMLQSQRFANLPPQNIQRVFERMERVDATANELIIRQGDPGGYYYVIEEGYCDVAREPGGGGREVHLAELGPGDGFGEEALVSDTPRNASVTMRSSGVLMRLDKESFIELIRDPLINRISYQDARRMIDEGAVWIDVRHRDQFSKGSFRNARNIPRAVIRVECRKLVKGRKYLVCGEEPGAGAAAAFLLAERGYDVSYLSEPLSKLFASQEAPVRPVAVVSEEADAETVVAFPPAPDETAGEDESEKRLIEKSMEESTESDEESPIVDLENGFGPSKPAPRNAYADTVTGARLADLVEEINEHFQELEGEGGQKEEDTLDEDALDIEGLDEAESVAPPPPEEPEQAPPAPPPGTAAGHPRHQGFRAEYSRRGDVADYAGDVAQAASLRQRVRICSAIALRGAASDAHGSDRGSGDKRAAPQGGRDPARLSEQVRSQGTGSSQALPAAGTACKQDHTTESRTAKGAQGSGGKAGHHG